MRNFLAYRGAVLPLLSLVVLGVMACGKTSDSLVNQAREFRSSLEREDYQAARALMAPDPRRWWESREGQGEPWRIGADHPGRWAEWDQHFRSQPEVLEWREDAVSATAVVRETNDYFRLLERDWVMTETTYFFDESGRIEGLLIAAVGERPRGRTDDFLEWARAHHSDELDYLMPDGEIDPSGDRPERYRELLIRWRQASGPDSIE